MEYPSRNEACRLKLMISRLYSVHGASSYAWRQGSVTLHFDLYCMLAKLGTFGKGACTVTCDPKVGSCCVGPLNVCTQRRNSMRHTHAHTGRWVKFWCIHVVLWAGSFLDLHGFIVLMCPMVQQVKLMCKSSWLWSWLPGNFLVSSPDMENSLVTIECFPGCVNSASSKNETTNQMA